MNYVPRSVHEAAAKLEAACARCEHPSPIGVAEHGMAFRQTLPARVLWHQVWRYMTERDNVALTFRSDSSWSMIPPSIICIRLRLSA